MESNAHRCPACRREFRSVLDYPRVCVLSFQRLPIPEAMDTMSGAAFEKRLARRKAAGTAQSHLSTDGVNMTPAIERACSTPVVQDYFQRLSQSVGQTVESREILPPLQADSRFTWAYPVDDTGVYLSLGEADNVGGDRRAAEVEVHCEGPNLGSAGGPTLQRLGAVARLEYQGLLAEGFE